MKSNDDIILTQELIKKDLALDSELPDLASDLEDLKKKLTPIINHLLDHDLNRLLTALYRIDVSEAKVKKVIASAKPEIIGDTIAQLIIDRELQKVETRRKYS
ncbi:hypothetical protein E1176_01295 [Fulvivirga sp. RKSG066]|uniref:hypothetical protein n=1 Tax=Fulvivirga aurantia TaxID=2529383 RepID=UPI0012BB527F|nr:hypothetical protein [Fulvivirga aurantia]MTI19647.1 hypothetical protein [Fulvivirga aurantia]